MKPKLSMRIVVISILLLIAVPSFYIFITTEEKGCSFIKGGNPVIISIKDDHFDPATTTISHCTEVVFKNDSSREVWPASDLHPTHGIYPEFDPKKPIAIGGSWTFVFDRIGNWKCHNHLSPLVRCLIEVTK